MSKKTKPIKDSIRKSNRPYAEHINPKGEDIYDNATKEESINDSDPFNDNEDLDKNSLEDELDIPGTELDNELENIGGEDEENNYYSLGGDNHENLEENRE